MIYNELATQFAKALEAKKKVSKISITVPQITSVLNVLDYVNAQGYGVTTIGRYQMREYRIPKGWKEFIYPEHLSFGGSRRNPDLLDRPVEAELATLIDPVTFNNLVDELMGAVRNVDQVMHIERDDLEALNADKEYFISGKYTDLTIEGVLYDLDATRVGGVLNTKYHVEDIKGEIARIFVSKLSANSPSGN